MANGELNVIYRAFATSYNEHLQVVYSRVRYRNAYAVLFASENE